MKIVLFVSEIDQVGGAEIGTHRLATRLARRNHDVVLLSTQGLSKWVRLGLVNDYANNVRLIRLPVWQRSLRTYSTMLTLLARLSFPALLRDAQILHLRGLSEPTLALARLARRYPIQSIAVPMASGVNGDLARLPPDLSHNLGDFDWISTLTEPMRAEVIAASYPTARTGVIPNGVDTHFFSPNDTPTLLPHVVYVGAFRPEKRIDLLLEAWQIVKKRHPQARLTLVGSGTRRAAYQQKAAALGIDPIFAPETDANGVRAHLRAGNIFVMPGISEGMSNALLEGMAVGLAPLVSDTPQNRAVVTNERNGLIYTSESAASLAAQLERLMGDTQLRQKLGTEARQTVLNQFELETVTRRYELLYKQLLGT